jgi:hypothetical protein
MHFLSLPRLASFTALLLSAQGVLALGACSASDDSPETDGGDAGTHGGSLDATAPDGGGSPPDAADGASTDSSPADADAGASADAAADGAGLDGGVSCTDVDPLVAIPGGPHGIYVFENLDSFDYPYHPSKNGFSPASPPSFLLDAPTVCGATVIVFWSAVDKGPDAGTQFDFSLIDSYIAPWVAAGKRVNLLIEEIRDAQPTAPNDVTPGYVLDEVPQEACGDDDTPYPQFWNPTYEAAYASYIGAVMARYGNDKDIGYLRFGLGGGAEAEISCPDIGDDGLTESIMESYVSTIESTIAKTTHTVPVVMPNASYATAKHENDGGLDNVRQLEVTTAIGYGFGLGTQTLSTGDMTDGGGCSATYCLGMAQGLGHVPLYAQTSTYCGGDSDGGCDLGVPPDGNGNQGPLPVLLPFGESIGAQIFELYPQDLQVAYDSTFPANASYGASYQAALEAAAAIVGRAK